jgi:hypothetical protein
MATFNIPCSGAGTIVLLTFNQGTSRRQIYGMNVDSAGNQAEYHGEGEYYTSIIINNGIATVEVYATSPSTSTTHFRCCFIPGDPFA